MISRLSITIVVAIGLGAVTGHLLHVGLDVTAAARSAAALHLTTEIFLRLIKMVIAPLVLATLITGIAQIGDVNVLGRIGLRALAWFLAASLASLGLGMMWANLLEPGVGLGLHSNGAGGGSGPSMHGFLLEVFPTSIADAAARNNILQVVVFSIFCGVALLALGERGRPIVALLEAVGAMMLKMTAYVMLLAPVATFSAVASVIAKRGLEIVASFGMLILDFYLALFSLWLVICLAGALVLGRGIAALLRAMRDPLLIGFATASSEATFPRMLEQLDTVDVPRRISSFVLSLGYSFNLAGSMMYGAFATLFIAQAYDVPLPLRTQFAILLVLLLTSKGMAAVPRAGLVVITATLTQFRLPVEGIALILAIDQLLDMGRTATNVLGNGIAAAVIAKWERDRDK
jgi:Na+/H+-dicarboxylate symporter